MMTDFIWLAPHWLWLLISPLVILAIGFYQHKQSYQALASFSQSHIKVRWLLGTNSLLALAITFISLALARPAWNPQPVGVDGQGRDIIFLIDVSRSMLAPDARPNRLAVARHAILQAVNANQGDRFGLVAFAGSASILSPLTNDKAFVKSLLDRMNTDSVPQGGTRIEDALFKVLDKMVSKASDVPAVDLILISDGEDLGSQPQRALEKLNQLGARLIVIGLGDSQFGARIPTRDGQGWVFDQERELWSKMNVKKLRQLSEGATQGMFFPVGTASFDLGKIITKLRQVWPGQSHYQSETIQYSQGYPYCLAIAALCLLLMLIGQRKALYAGLALLSFTSHAIENVPENNRGKPLIQVEQSQAKVTQLSATQLKALPLRQQFAHAAQLFEQTPEQAADIYRDIASQATDIKVAIRANYNYATSLIAYGELLNEQLALLAEPGALNPETLEAILNFNLDDENFIDPEPYYQQAAAILRLILVQAPKHRASANNLEWLTMRKAQREKAKQLQENQQSQQQDSQQQPAQEKTDQQNNNQQQKKQDNQQGGNDSDSQQEQSAQQSQQSDVDLSNLHLPTANTSAQDIMKQAKKRDQQDRSQQRKKQRPVERDW